MSEGATGSRRRCCRWRDPAGRAEPGAFKGIVAENRIGNLKPSAPVLVHNSLLSINTSLNGIFSGQVPTSGCGAF